MKVLVVLCLVVLRFFTSGVAASEGGLKYSYYYQTCPQAEAIIASTMKDISSKDIRVPPRLIRMHFHDCIVRGCDGSILINSTKGNKAEKDAAPNNPSLQGFEAIDQIKEVLERQCPGVVSCADILTYAARESVYLSGKFKYYDVRGGRKDGKISKASEATLILPPSSDDAKSLIKLFESKGLSLKDMVTLSGAHSMGVSFCSAIKGRFVNFNNTGKPDPTLDSGLASILRQDCRNVGGVDLIVPMDRVTPMVLDNNYYKGLLQHKGLFMSDQTLLSDKHMRKQVMKYALKASAWEKKFVRSMRKMGEVEVLTGEKGEIRKKCSRIN